MNKCTIRNPALPVFLFIIISIKVKKLYVPASTAMQFNAECLFCLLSQVIDNSLVYSKTLETREYSFPLMSVTVICILEYF